MQILRALPLATLLALSLLSFGCDSALPIDEGVLFRIIENLRCFQPCDRRGPVQYAVGIRLGEAVCTGSKQMNLSTQLPQMKKQLHDLGGLYNGESLVAARVQGNIGEYRVHAEWRLLSHANNNRSWVQQLLSRNNNERCLIFYTFRSPCKSRCLNETHNSNIINSVREVFNLVQRGAFVFDRVYEEVTNTTQRDELVRAWSNLGNIPTYHCYTKSCVYCSRDQNTWNRCTQDN
ncbi:uncharacterized protein LOC103167484 [Ornithorhynchus anatinus]|uniref:uncharacterized protein LOC103167484 n=1 Tax=Ornithorhynchus anatinus TaxID=9258 RepID=UPI0010A92146|nr:uncharacterized protein LOC103167484 [Ornithorhynchus anatinus]